MQNLERLLFVSFLALIFCFCKNQPVQPETKPAGETPTSLSIAADSLAGFKGVDPAQFTRTSPGSAEYRYQRYVVKVMPRPDRPGQNILAMPAEGAKPFAVPTLENCFFAGIYRDHLFLDIGTGPGGREFVIFNLKKNTSEYQTLYIGEPEILPNGRLLFLLPTAEKDVTKMPECPDRADWEQKGLSIGYGQVCFYSLDKDVVIKKSEWRCLPLQ